MATFDAQSIFGSGPSSFKVEGWRVATRRDGFPGLDGASQLVLGARGRRIHQQGHIVNSSVSALRSILAYIVGYQKAATPHTLIDNHNAIFTNAVMTSLEYGPIQRTVDGYVVKYEIEYLQLSED